MTRKLNGTFIESGTVTANQLAASVNDKSNAAYTQANSAYSQANTALAAANSASGGFSKSFLMSGL